MHPTLSRYLSLQAIHDTLRRQERGEALRAAERAWTAAAAANGEWAERVKQADPAAHPSPEVQQAILLLAAKAAALSLREDDRLAAPLAQARQVMRDEGASDDEVEALVASLLLEEALAYDDSPDEFSTGFFEETLRGIPDLARLTQDRVDALIDAFIAQADPAWRVAHEAAAWSLLQGAWSEGPQPINPEHVADAINASVQKLGDADALRAIEAVRRFLEFLAHEGLMGPERLRRMTEALSAAAADRAPPERPN